MTGKRFRLVCLSASLALLLGVDVCRDTAFLEAGTVSFDSKEDWGKWAFPEGTLELTEEGWVRPVFIEKNINAVLDARQHFVTRPDGTKEWGGIRAAGSNPTSAPDLMDGDLSTSWGPDQRDDLDRWWIEVDLGRLITTTRIVLRFAEGAEPFRLFEVYVSDGMPAFKGLREVLRYELAGRETAPNEEYVVEYGVPLKQVRFVRIDLTARSANPRLAELEVFSVGRNIALGTVERGGYSIAMTTGGERGDGGNTMDGDATSYWATRTSFKFGVEAAWKENGWMFWDLGGLFWVDAIYIISMPRSTMKDSDAPIYEYKLDTSDGSEASGVEDVGIMGPYLWQEVVHYNTGMTAAGTAEEQAALSYFHKNYFPLRPVRYLFFSNRNSFGERVRDAYVQEFQVYGEGYMAGVEAVSEFVDLGRSNNLTSVEWVAETPPGSNLEIRTRTGDTLIEEIHYYDQGGNEISQKDWERQKKFHREGPVKTIARAGEGWSAWSPPYLRSGDPFLSPSPRRYLQVKVNFSNETPAVAASLDRIVLSYSDPVAKTLWGEIWPKRVDRPATDQAFSYYIKSSFDAGSSGFDEILIQTPSKPELLGVYVGDEWVAPDSVRSTQDSLWLRLPQRVRSETLVEVQFRCRIFLNGTPLKAQVAYSEKPDAWQGVDPGNATDLVKSETTTVLLPIDEELIGNVAVSPGVITPNGDGENEEAVVAFSVFKVNVPRSIGVAIYSVKGDRIRELIDQPGLSGNYQVAWDGRDESGEIVPPGPYVCQIKVGGKLGDTLVSRTIGVVY